MAFNPDYSDQAVRSALKKIAIDMSEVFAQKQG